MDDRMGDGTRWITIAWMSPDKSLGKCRSHKSVDKPRSSLLTLKERWVRSVVEISVRHRLTGSSFLLTDVNLTNDWRNVNMLALASRCSKWQFGIMCSMIGSMTVDLRKYDGHRCNNLSGEHTNEWIIGIRHQTVGQTLMTVGRNHRLGRAFVWTRRDCSGSRRFVSSDSHWWKRSTRWNPNRRRIHRQQSISSTENRNARSRCNSWWSSWKVS